MKPAIVQTAVSVQRSAPAMRRAPAVIRTQAITPAISASIERTAAVFGP
jgi:hypothetical protein